VDEARTGKRFPLELPIRIHRSGNGNRLQGDDGESERGGVYIRADDSFEVGSPVDFEVVLPAASTGGQESVLVCKGRVVRIDNLADGKPGETRGVAS